MRVGMLTTWRIRCGIAAYTEALVNALCEQPDVQVEVVPITPGIQSPEHYAEQAARLNACDVVHIQHEYSFWGGFVPGKNRYRLLRAGVVRPLVLTAHTTSCVEELIVLPEPLKVGAVSARLRLAYRRARMRAVFPALRRVPAYRRWVEVAPFASAEEVIVHTGQGLEALAGRGIARDRLHLLPAGIPPALPSKDSAADLIARYGLQGSRLVTLFGYVNPFKGNEVALSALRSLPEDVCLIIAGGARTPSDEPYVTRLRARLAAELPGRAAVTGFLDEEAVADAMTASDVVIAPHTLATGSYSITAPLAYGKPVVASDLACFREIADRGGGIVLFPPGDAASLAGRLRSLLNDASARASMSAAARAYADSHSWRHVAEQTEAIYRLAMLAASDDRR